MAARTRLVAGLGHAGRLLGSFAGKAQNVSEPAKAVLSSALQTSAALSEALVTTAALTESLTTTATLSASIEY